MEKLTPKERECREALAALIKAGLEHPTIADVGREMGLTKAGAQRHMEALKRKGAIRGPKLVGDWELIESEWPDEPA